MLLGKARKAAISNEQAQREKIIVYQRAFGSDDGRAVLFDLMNRYHILSDHKGDMHAEGQRSVVLDILKRCNINVQEFDKLLKGELV